MGLAKTELDDGLTTKVESARYDEFVGTLPRLRWETRLQRQ